MNRDITEAVRDIKQALLNLEGFIPNGRPEIYEAFTKTWYHLAFGIYHLETFYAEAEK